MQISVIINTYNAQRHLEEVLNSLRCFDQIVICDMHSSDATQDIAQRFGCKVVEHDYCGGICEPARNAAIAAADCPWVLVVDADELIPLGLRQALYACIQAPNPPAGLFIPRKNFFMGRFMHATYPDYVLRFFRKEAVYWPSQVHAIPMVKGPIRSMNRYRTDLAIIHLEESSMFGRIRKQMIYRRFDAKGGVGNYSRLRLFFSCIARFIKFYFIKQGWRDGKPGFYYALLFSYHRYRIYRK